jgi:hypothetical protein
VAHSRQNENDFSIDLKRAKEEMTKSLQKTFAVLFLLCGVVACSREQATAAANGVGKSYLESNRDSIIRNWQARVASTPQCAQFKDRFLAAGSRYDNAVNGMFVGDMLKIWDATKAGGCAAPV